MRPKIAVFSFTSCEGCQLTILNLEEEMLDLLGAVEIVNFREAMDSRRHDYEIAFIEGSITTEEEALEVAEIRRTAGLVVAIGACACLGGINALKDRRDLDAVRRQVYGDKARHFESRPARRVRELVAVDYEMHGCPIDREEFLRVTKKLLIGQRPAPPERAVCVECKIASTVCLFDRGGVCLGAVSRSGCGAICPAFGEECVGCRGLLREANLPSMLEILRAKGLAPAQIEDRFVLFNNLDAAALDLVRGNHEAV